MAVLRRATHPPELMFTFTARNVVLTVRQNGIQLNQETKRVGREKRPKRKRVREWKESRREQRT